MAPTDFVDQIIDSVGLFIFRMGSFFYRQNMFALGTPGKRGKREVLLATRG
jgi:hypothetical protein